MHLLFVRTDPNCLCKPLPFVKLRLGRQAYVVRTYSTYTYYTRAWRQPNDKNVFSRPEQYFTFPFFRLRYLRTYAYSNMPKMKMMPQVAPGGGKMNGLYFGQLWIECVSRLSGNPWPQLYTLFCPVRPEEKVSWKPPEGRNKSKNKKTQEEITDLCIERRYLVYSRLAYRKSSGRLLSLFEV